ncbi:hypothetical protein HJG60_009823 [Phyllostomus discolor]|uniref:Uncharacterized protein n=1 Tax=Phyllostomus discolor TaxID=89673 RepID=A0A834BCM3_9CHIR|nr:hypothetical protein HJG60_009823 [Phyllostomus discolor]
MGSGSEQRLHHGSLVLPHWVSRERRRPHSGARSPPGTTAPPVTDLGLRANPFTETPSSTQFACWCGSSDLCSKLALWLGRYPFGSWPCPFLTLPCLQRTLEPHAWILPLSACSTWVFRASV